MASGVQSSRERLIYLRAMFCEHKLLSRISPSVLKAFSPLALELYVDDTRYPMLVNVGSSVVTQQQRPAGRRLPSAV